eukprot:TRINITY_DN4145_c0_g1_i1.p1 TRINITY_DN4145_c0_g1~~TRINITY_DN4145_c0_g1_i1.p1  ORF type:complete len:410 (+),score=75.63 TRINITY_DN4145_c0_g1_i1:794-2023(+)
MSLRGFVRDVRQGIGSISKRGFDVKMPNLHRARSERVRYDGEKALVLQDQQSCWANLPPELLRDVMQRIEASEDTWPARKHVVACAAVCRSWREVCKEVVKSLEECGKLTFPISLKQPAPRDSAMQCYIKRDRSNATFHLFMCLSPALLVENGKFLLAAKRVRHASSIEYIISLDPEEISQTNSSYLGKLRSNFMGTKFSIYDSQAPCSDGVTASSRSRRFYSNKVSPRVPAGNYNIAKIAYELNVLGSRGPRRMQCTIYCIPASAAEGGPLPKPQESVCSFTSPSSSSLNTIDHKGQSHRSALALVDSTNKPNPLVLRNKAPRWHEQLQCWCLNFKGRVTVASVKNFQLVAAPDTSSLATNNNDHDRVILQFGKIGKDIFTMDCRYPLSVFQAFAIALSSFDTKLACE